MQQKSILILRLSSIGDILLTTPFIRQLRHRFNQARIDYVTKKKFKELLQYNPHIDTIHEIDNNLSDLTFKLQKTSYDYIFDLHNNFRSIYIRSKLKSEFKGIIRKEKLNQLLLLFLHINRYKDPRPIPSRYLATAEQLGVTDDNEGLELYWPEQIGIDTADFLSNYGLDGDHKYVCLAPGAGFFTKRWPPEYYQQLIRLINAHLNLKIVILGGSGDAAIGEQLSHSDDVFNFCGKLSLLESAVILSKGLAVVSNDTGLMHMATAVQKPVVAIFGSSIVEWGFAPFRCEHVLVEQSKLICRPCSHIGRHECPQKHFRCMKEITPARVFNALRSLLEKQDQ